MSLLIGGFVGGGLDRPRDAADGTRDMGAERARPKASCDASES